MRSAAKAKESDRPLTRVGRERSLDYLREKLLDPSKSITPGYHTIAVTLRDGRVIRGVEKGFDDFSAQLLDVNRQFHSFRKEEVASMKREEQSLMPADYGAETHRCRTDRSAGLSGVACEVKMRTPAIASGCVHARAGRRRIVVDHLRQELRRLALQRAHQDRLRVTSSAWRRPGSSRPTRPPEWKRRRWCATASCT